MTFEEYKKEVDKNINNLFSKANEEERKLLNNMIKTINEMCEKEKELIDYLKEQVKLCKKAQQLALQNKMIEQVGNFNLRIATYNEILSKIEKGKI